MVGQIEKRLGKRTGRDLSERRDAASPMPTSNSEQRRLMAPGNRHAGSNSFGVMIQFVGNEDILWRCRSEQTLSEGTTDGVTQRSEPAVIQSDAGRSRLVFGETPERADQRIVICYLDR